MRASAYRVGAGLVCVCVVLLNTPVAVVGQASEVVVRVPPTMWTVAQDNPPCQLQVYIGRVNTTQDAASCRRVCVPRAALPSNFRLRKFSRDEGGSWQEGAVPWAAWEESIEHPGCAVFKNWSHNRFREAKVVAEGSR